MKNVKWKLNKSFLVSSVLIMVTNLMDYCSTTYALNKGFIEANPIMNIAINADKLLLVKMGVPLLVIVFCILRIKTPESLRRICKIFNVLSAIIILVSIYNLSIATLIQI